MSSPGQGVGCGPQSLLLIVYHISWGKSSHSTISRIKKIVIIIVIRINIIGTTSSLLALI